MMIDFSILDQAGRVVRYGTCPSDMLEKQAKSGESVVEGIVQNTANEPLYNYTYKRMRAYPEVGEQLDAIFKLATALKASGVVIPADTLAWINSVQDVKDQYPKGGV